MYGTSLENTSGIPKTSMDVFPNEVTENGSSTFRGHLLKVSEFQFCDVLPYKLSKIQYYNTWQVGCIVLDMYHVKHIIMIYGNDWCLSYCYFVLILHDLCRRNHMIFTRVSTPIKVDMRPRMRPF